MLFQIEKHYAGDIVEKEWRERVPLANSSQDCEQPAPAVFGESHMCGLLAIGLPQVALSVRFDANFEQ